jgi:tRNA pseudouridine38-40 synthase
MPRIKLILEYDGTEYVGWQAQTNGPSIEERVRTAVRQLLGEEIQIEAATRTDSGVHALGQVVCFVTSRTLPMKAYYMGLNDLLPGDIAVVGASEVAANFDPRRDAKGKRYRYLISNHRHRSPTRRRTHWEVFQPLDVSAMRRGAEPLVGEHDFSAFQAADCQAAHARRELRALSVEIAPGKEIAISIEGTAFLKHMVRNIVGSLVEVGRARRSPEWIREVLESRDRTLAGPTAPAHGLTLLEVLYACG